MNIKSVLNIAQKILFGSYSNASPADGEIWYDGADICFRMGSASHKLDKYIIMGSDQSLTTNSTTFQDVTSLVFTPDINSTYLIDWLIKRADAGGDNTKLTATFPSGATWMMSASNSSIAFNSGSSWVNNFPLGGTGFTRARGILTMGSTSGNFQIRAAQANGEATAHVLKKGSFILPRKLV